MLVVVSPAKNLDYDSPSPTETHTLPDYLSAAEQLVQRCKQLTPVQLSELMGISDKLAGLNAARFSSWSLPFTQDNAKQAVLAFNGDVYSGLQADSFSDQDFAFAQQHMCILSGLYGLLKPLDLMQPYRLEMGTKLTNQRGKDLYEFWGNTITDGINQALQQQGDDILINLASNEYFKSVNKKKLAGKIITPVFKDYKNGQYKVISFFAKKARGAMARFIIQQQLSSPQQLTEFDSDGYAFNSQLSDAKQLVFTREQSA